VYYFVGIDGARFKRPVTPGDQLVIEVEQGAGGRAAWPNSQRGREGRRRRRRGGGVALRIEAALSQVHATAIVDKRAQLGANVSVGPYTVIDGDVEIGAGTTIGAHNVITGHTRIGRDNRIFHFCSIGEANQDKKYKGEPTRLEIGDRNTIREYCSLNRGTVQDAGVTRVGDDNWLMAYCHVAHDCQVGSNTVFANHATLGGHVHIGDWTVLGGFVGVHQFVKIGEHVMAGVSSVILQDVPPYRDWSRASPARPTASTPRA
jgi:UDP-N-acetylglucosamine acyltransferase